MKLYFESSIVTPGFFHNFSFCKKIIVYRPPCLFSSCLDVIIFVNKLKTVENN